MNRNYRNQLYEILKPLTLVLLIIASTVFIFTSVSLPPAASQASSVEAEVLATQIEFILKMNSAFLAFLGIIGALLTWFFKNSLDDAKKIAREVVRQELIEHIKPLVEEEAQYLKRTLRTEQVIGDTSVYYYLASSSNQHPFECKMLIDRGFHVYFNNRDKQPGRWIGEVLVIDISNSLENDNYLKMEENSEQQKQSFTMLSSLINTVLDDFLQNRPENKMPVLIIYVRPGKTRITVIDRLKSEYPNVKHYTSANTPVALMGAVVDSAYVAYSDRLSNNS